MHRACDDPLLVEAHVQGGSAAGELTARTPGLQDALAQLAQLGDHRDHRTHVEAGADADLVNAWKINRNQRLNIFRKFRKSKLATFAHNLFHNSMKIVKTSHTLIEANSSLIGVFNLGLGLLGLLAISHHTGSALSSYSASVDSFLLDVFGILAAPRFRVMEFHELV